MSIKEDRRKLQGGVVNLAQCSKVETALHGLSLLKRTVDSQVELLVNKLLLQEGEDDASNTEAQKDDVAKAAEQGFDTIYKEAG